MTEAEKRVFEVTAAILGKCPRNETCYRPNLPGFAMVETLSGSWGRCGDCGAYYVADMKNPSNQR